MSKTVQTKESNLQGQALLLVVLGMAIVLTMVLSIISRSVTDVAITSKDEDSLRAFSAAEAGVEQALLVGKDVSQSDYFNAEYSDFSSSVSEFIVPKHLGSGESAIIWFVDHNKESLLTCSSNTCFNPGSTGDFGLCWAGESENVTPQDKTPAVEVTLYYDTNYSDTSNNALADDTSSPANYEGVQVSRIVYDPLEIRVQNSDFKTASSGCTQMSTNFKFSAPSILTDMDVDSDCLSSQGCLLFASVRMLYNDNQKHTLGAFVTDDKFPRQGVKVASTGESNEAKRKIEVVNTFNAPPSVFENSIYSPNQIVKGSN